MWVRTQLKIGFGTLARAYVASLRGLDEEKERARAEAYFNSDDVIAAYSVRSGFDLLLQSLPLKPGDEVLFTALNVKGMVRVVKEMGLVPVPLDLDVDSMSPTKGALQRALSKKSKVLVAAHLFGARMNFDGIFRLARQRGLVVVEDCAQAFNGRDYAGHPDADISMYSFGPIKTATALGGALLRVRPAALRAKMRTIQQAYPLQRDRQHRKRMLQFAGLKLATSRFGLGLIYRYYKMRGLDYEDALADRVRDVAPLKTKASLRQRPSASMLHLLNRRLAAYDAADIALRARKGQFLAERLRSVVTLPALGNSHHDFWGFAMLVSEPGLYIQRLRDKGFDAATLNRSQHISAPPGRPQLEPRTAAGVMRQLVVLPCYQSMPDRELARLADAVSDIHRKHAGNGPAAS
jgi:dTDP-4-amino-4,6-dideoxygalactose transaminase